MTSTGLAIGRVSRGGGRIVVPKTPYAIRLNGLELIGSWKRPLAHFQDRAFVLLAAFQGGLFSVRCETCDWLIS